MYATEGWRFNVARLVGGWRNIVHRRAFQIRGWPVGITAGVKPKGRGLGFFNKPHWLGN